MNETTETAPARKPRQTRSLRLGPAGEAHVQRVAERDGLLWSEAARRLLAYAVANMPVGWHPGAER